MGTDTDSADIELELLIQAIYLRYHYDFRNYSRASLKRRVTQALIRHKVPTTSELQALLIHDPNFFTKLLPFLTVSTTEMFRDPDYYRQVREQVVPFLRTYPSIKIWIAGCSTGEEVVSMAILLKEEGVLSRSLIYATDINPESLAAAQRAIYAPEIVRKASQNYQASGGRAAFSDYYDAAYDSVRFDPTLLNNVVFSDHSLATDSVFSEVHFISCRNVLIYFNRELQDRAVGLFRDSLVRNGFLGLGSKESLLFSAHRDSFDKIVPEQRIFRRS